MYILFISDFHLSSSESELNAELFPGKVHNCSYCSYSTYRSYSLRRHMLIHTGEKPFTCNICERGFAQKSHLTYHLKTHSKYILNSK